MPNNPTWLDEDFYLKSKLNQLNTTDPAAGWTMETMCQAIKNAGFTALSHFESYSLTERTSPNPFFNAFEYLQAKLKQLQKVEPGKYSNIDQVAIAIQDAGLNLWDHFQQFGWSEGVNPSNSFDIDEYFVSKLEQLQRTDSDGSWTLEKMTAAFVDAGIDPVSHYLMYGKNEPGVKPAVVPEANRVPADPHPVEPGPTPEPEPTPEATFTVTEDGGVVTFSGTATGNITFTLDDTVATFSRGGVTATTTADLETITKITVGSGQTLSATAAHVTGKTIDGAGNVSVTALHATGDANLSLITNSGTKTATVSEDVTFTGNLGTFTTTVAARKTLTADAAELHGKTVTGTGSVNVNVLAAGTNLSGLNTTLTVTANVVYDLNISENNNLSTVDTFNLPDVSTTLALTAAQADGKSLTGDGGVLITGSEGAQTINVATFGANMIVGGKGEDQITLGDGVDMVVVLGGVQSSDAGTYAIAVTMGTISGVKLTLTLPDSSMVELDDQAVDAATYTFTAGLASGNNLVIANLVGGAVVDGDKYQVIIASNGASTASVTNATNVTEFNTSGACIDVPLASADTTGTTFDTSTLGFSDSTPTAYDTITNFTLGTDTLYLCASTLFNSDSTIPFVVVNGIVGLVDFDGTAAEKLDYVLIQLAFGAAGMTSAYFDGTDTYIFQSDGVVGLQDSDVLVKLAGVEVTNFTDDLAA